MVRVKMRMAGPGKDGGVIWYETIRELKSIRLIRRRRTNQFLRHQAAFLGQVKRPRKETFSGEKVLLIYLRLRHRIPDLNRHNHQNNLQLAHFAGGFSVCVESTLQFSIATMPSEQHIPNQFPPFSTP